MRYKSRNDQLNQLDGDKARMDIGREDCLVYPQGAEDTPSIRGSPSAASDTRPICTFKTFSNAYERARLRPRRCGSDSRLRLSSNSQICRMKHGKRVRWNDTLKKVEI